MTSVEAVPYYMIYIHFESEKISACSYLTSVGLGTLHTSEYIQPYLNTGANVLTNALLMTRNACDVQSMDYLVVVVVSHVDGVRQCL
jgi:hypothetical protein